jgi:hypothetical protein
VVAVVTAGTALAASGTTAAAAPGVNAAAGSIAEGASAIGTAGGAAATASSSTWATVQSVAKYVGQVSGIAGKVTGNDDANRLAATANLMTSPSWKDAINKGTEFVLKQDNLKIDQQNQQAKAAANELIQREQEAYAAKLRELADLEAKKQHVEIKQPEKITLKDMLPYLIPLGIAILRG